MELDYNKHRNVRLFVLNSIMFINVRFSATIQYSNAIRFSIVPNFIIFLNDR
jgi:hypothetical protein